jgi:hypothetical protein
VAIKVIWVVMVLRVIKVTVFRPFIRVTSFIRDTKVSTVSIIEF